MTRSADRGRASARTARKSGPPVPLIALAVGVGILGLVALSWVRQGTRGAGGVATEGPELAGFEGQAPNFTVNTLEHGPFTLSEQRGRPVLLFFSSPT